MGKQNSLTWLLVDTMENKSILEDMSVSFSLEETKYLGKNHNWHLVGKANFGQKKCIFGHLAEDKAKVG